jgi:solute carrier family 35 protein F1/2
MTLDASKATATGQYAPNTSGNDAVPPAHGTPEIIAVDDKGRTSSDQNSKDIAIEHDRKVPAIATTATDDAPIDPVQPVNESDKGYFAYIKTKQFWIVLLLGQILALCITATNTFSGLLANNGNNIPAFQTFFNYVLLNLIYTSYTIYRYGFPGWGKMLKSRGWKYIIFSFCDVEGNYFTVLAYRYATILSIQLINFWAIVLVVLVSFLFLKVRYGWTQVLGILICVGGLGLLLGSDHITGANGYYGSDYQALKGDLFALLGATFYGLANVAEEYLVSEQPVYEVIGQIGFWGMIINGVQAAIFDRQSFQDAPWSPALGGYLAGYTLALTLFYSLAPLVFRLGSAAFFNISLLTVNFWGVVIGIQVFGYTIYYLYPIAFVMIIIGLVIYFVGKQVLGEALKPWLGSNQERGVNGLGTAKRIADRPTTLV